VLTALVLICSLAVTPDLRDCDQARAVGVLDVPGSFKLPAACFVSAQAYIAETSLPAHMASEERIKIVCAKAAAADATGRL
jgi:hypothetical protein